MPLPHTWSELKNEVKDKVEWLSGRLGYDLDPMGAGLAMATVVVVVWAVVVTGIRVAIMQVCISTTSAVPPMRLSVT